MMKGESHTPWWNTYLLCVKSWALSPEPPKQNRIKNTGRRKRRRRGRERRRRLNCLLFSCLYLKYKALGAIPRRVGHGLPKGKEGNEEEKARKRNFI